MGAKEGFKKGQLSPGVLITLIIIVLVLIVGAIVYVVVSDKGGEKSAIELEKAQADIEKEAVSSPISAQCKFACDSAQKTSFCDVERKVTESITTTCKELATNSQYSSYNVQPCSTIDCNPIPTAQELDQTCVTGLGGTWENPTSGGGCAPGGNKIRRQVTPSDNPPSAGQICCR